MIQGIHHFAVIVSSLASLDFYRKLGFEEFKRVERRYDTVVLLYGHGIQIECFIDPTHPPRSNPDPLGLRHIALRVDDIEKTIEELECEAGPIMNDWVGEKFCFIADPDGNTVELHE